MALITMQNVDYSVGGPLLLDDARFTLEAGERVCVVGRNGAGKSTLLKLLGGDLVPDDGDVVAAPGLRVARLTQEVPHEIVGRVDEVVARGLAEGDAEEWDRERRVREVLARLALPAELPFAALSGGMKRRVLLARALVRQPDVLLLDEPTNHLDIESIAWLEDFLRGLRGSLVFVTHDRRFLRALATRIVEIDRGQLTSWPGDYDNYLRRREERLHAESQANALFDKKLADEEVWIRQGIKARRTRNEGRVRALEKLRRERGERREQQGRVRMDVAAAEKSGKRVIEAEDVSFAIGGRTLVRDLSVSIQRGDRVGLLGPNGAGKTTLIRLLLGELPPDRGEVTLGTNLQVAYFDQHRATLREDWNALDNVAEGSEFIEVNGARKHALGYLQDFLFTPERARAPITALSGGERNRLLLARLFARPSNLLVMDEPTNDLDVETLEMLEERLGEYPGTLLLVSHDRDFLDSVVTSTLVMEGEGRVGEYVGGYSDWLRQRAQPATAPPAPAKPVAIKSAQAAPAKKKLSYNDQRELDALPAKIDALEAKVAALTEAMQSPDFYTRDSAAVSAALAEAADAQKQLDAAYERWAQLDG